MKKILIVLLLLTGCAKEQLNERMVQLTVEGHGGYLVTYGTSDPVTLKSEAKWSTILSAYPGDTIQLSVQTTENPATLYLGIEIEEDLLFCRSLYIEPESVGTLSYVVDR